MFYLKCLSDEQEIEELIKREIDERDWFIYADSPNARASKWVKTERDYIETLTGKKIFTIDLNTDINTQLKQIEHITRQMKVFISFSHRDIELQRLIKAKLLEMDMKVLCDEDELLVKTLWSESIYNAVNEASRDGFVILLITENSKNSDAVKHEIDLTLRCGGKIVPVMVGDVKLSPELLHYIGDRVGVHISEQPTEEELEAIADGVLRLVSYSEDFKDTYGYRYAKTIHLPEISRIDNTTFYECEFLECVYIPDSVIYITPDAFEEHPDILVKCSKGSYAEQYCKRNFINYQLI